MADDEPEEVAAATEEEPATEEVAEVEIEMSVLDALKEVRLSIVAGPDNDSFIAIYECVTWYMYVTHEPENLTSFTFWGASNLRW